jgi:hypothetical protein
MSDSPIERLLGSIDTLDAEGAMELLEPGACLLTADGRRAEGKEAARKLLGSYLGSLRSTRHQITSQWHIDDVWIAEVDASYELQDWLRLNDLPRVFVVRMKGEQIADVRVYGAHEQPLTDHPSGEEGMWIGNRWIPPL